MEPNKITKDEHGRIVEKEWPDGSWDRYEYDELGRVAYWEDSSGEWERREYTEDGQRREVYYADSTGYWSRHVYDSEGNETYYENSLGSKVGEPSSVKETDG